MTGSDRFLFARHVILDPAPISERVPLARRTASVVVVSLIPVLIAIGCWHDGTWTMDDPNKGLVEHYGYWAIFVTTPIILLLSARLLRQFAATIQGLDNYCATSDPDVRAKAARLVANHIRSLSLRTQSAWILVFTVFVMVCWCILNVLKTIRPNETYGHDVFDAYGHPWGFFAAKVYVFIVFGLIYSLATFIALHVTVSMVDILRFLRQHDALKVDLFHRDNCGGTSKFGDVNLLILMIYFDFFVVIFGMYETHKTTYLVMIVSFIACSLLVTLQSIFAVYYIHRVVADRKRDCIELVTARLNAAMAASLAPNGRFPADLLALRNHIVGVSSFPYAKGVAAIVNVIRFAPAALAVVARFRT